MYVCNISQEVKGQNALLCPVQLFFKVFHHYIQLIIRLSALTRALTTPLA